MKSHLIVTDLDGTLLNDEHDVSLANLKWIQSFKERGGLFTFATGRMNKTVEQFIKKLQITLPVITYNGAQIYCPVEKKVIYEKSYALPGAMLERLLVAAGSFAEVLFFYEDDVFTLERGPLIREFEKKEEIESKYITVKDIPSDVTKVILLSGDKKSLHTFETGIDRQFPEDVDLIYSESNYLEILPKNVSKGEALRVLKEQYTLTDRYTVGFGNSYNDISLLQAADLGIAVGNAVDRLIESADEVSLYSNAEDAVGRYIETLLHTADENLLV